MAPTRFAFLDEGEALRRLNVDRDTLRAFVEQGRLKAHGVGIHHYYRTKDVDALYAELFGDAAEGTPTETKTPAAGKPFDPAYKVHVRLQADLKWYDLSDDDLRAWAREMTEDGYPRQRANIQMVMGKLQRMIELMDEAAADWQVLKPAHPAPREAEPQTAATPAAEARPKSLRGKPLAMLGGGAPSPSPSPSPAPTQPPAPAGAPITPTRRGKPLPLAGAPRPVENEPPKE